MTNFTPAQLAAFSQVKDIMREHFDAGLFVIVVDHETDALAEVTEFTWHGGYTRVVGLAEIAKMRLTKKEFVPETQAEKEGTES